MTERHRQGSGVRGGTDLVVELAVDGLAVVVEQLEGVRAVAVHVAVAVGKTAVAEQEGHLQGQETGNISAWKDDVNAKIRRRRRIYPSLSTFNHLQRR